MKREVIGMLVLFLLCFFYISSVVSNIKNEIAKAGGIKEVIITTGKEIKEIREEINR